MEYDAYVERGEKGHGMCVTESNAHPFPVLRWNRSNMIINQRFRSKSILLSLNNIVREVLPVAANDPYLQSETVSARKPNTMKGD